jgi:NAD(P)-dependent dehydrogenase (short-subunit alcohol dehydrogenase family)
MNLQDKVAIVTGGTKGIGRAIAESLLKNGAKVFICARNRDELKSAVAEMSELGEVEGELCDARSFEQVKAMIDECERKFGGVDVLVNNAGIGIFKSVEELAPEEFQAVLETNLFGVFYACHAAIPLMKQRGGGYIINVSSLAGTNAHPKMSAYNASKFGLNGFSEALMQEVRQDNIKVSYIMPGSVNTEFGGEEVSPDKAWQLQPADIAQVVLDLLQMNERALPSRVELRPSRPPQKG